MRATNGPYKGRDITVDKHQPFVLANPLRSITVHGPYTDKKLIVPRVEIKTWTK